MVATTVGWYLQGNTNSPISEVVQDFVHPQYVWCTNPPLLFPWVVALAKEKCVYTLHFCYTPSLKGWFLVYDPSFLENVFAYTLHSWYTTPPLPLKAVLASKSGIKRRVLLENRRRCRDRPGTAIHPNAILTHSLSGHLHFAQDLGKCKQPQDPASIGGPTTHRLAKSTHSSERRTLLGTFRRVSWF